MGCVIKYKGQSIPEEQFLQHLSKQIAINNLFNEDENLANEVYEALGFTGTISLESNLKNTGKTEQELIKYLQKKYPEIKLNITNNPVWEKGDNIFNQEEYTNQINYRLKAVDILSSDKALQIFKKGENNNWDLNKILTELQIPKQQKKIILDKDITDREEIITSLLADNSFTVEINTAIDKESTWDMRAEPTNAKYYSNMTVPGGTNYTEQEIATPAITPSIKGHAAFATDKGIGWFRSDDKTRYITEEERSYMSYDDPDYNKIEGEATKTRRILEVQSDLFQKGRDIKSPDEIIQELQKSGKLEIKCS